MASNSWRQSKFLITLTVTFAVFVDLFLYGLVVPILPPILKDRIGIPATDIQFWLSVNFVAYNVATIITCPIFGWIADHSRNRKTPLLVGLVALAASNVLFALGKTLTTITIARVLQSISASMVWAVGLALLVDSVEDDEVNVSMGWVSTAVSIALASGPFLGGILYENLGHFPTFAIATGVTVIDIILRLIIVDPSRRSTDKKAATDNNSVTTPLLSDSRPQPGTGSPKQRSALMIMITDKGLLRASLLVIVAALIQQALETILALYVESEFDWSTQDAGLVFLGLMVPALAGPIIGYLATKVGENIMSAFGFTIMAICHCLLCFIRDSHTKTIVALVSLLFGIGVGISTVLTLQMAALASFASRKEKEVPGTFGSGGATAQCCSLYNTVYSTSGILGPAIAGALQINYGWKVSTVTLGIFALLGLVFCLLPACKEIVSKRADPVKVNGGDGFN